jgi:hypothetical protein
LRFTNELRLAHLTTNYVVKDGRRDVAIRPGTRNRDVDRLLSKLKALTANFVTACNPHSCVFSQSVNQQRQLLLKKQLYRRGLQFLDGEGRGEIGNWPPEQSVLVLGVTREDSKAIGRSWRQNAIIFVRLGWKTELLMLR